MTDSTLLEQLIASIERLCAGILPRFQTPEYENTLPRELFKCFADSGVTALSVPERFGGAGAGAAIFATAVETIARFDLGPAIFLSVHSMVEGLINRFGDDAQHTTVLPKLASGEWLAAFALTEPEAGSDASNLKTQAIPCDGGFKIRGSKCYITSAGSADLYLVFCATDLNGERGISAFLVPSTSTGLSVGKPEKKMGCELSPIASLFFDDLFVPTTALLGSYNEGYRIALSGLAGGRVNIAACANGISRTAIELALKHIKDRKQFGSAIVDFQGIQFMIADMYTKLEAARLLTAKAAQDLEDAASDPNCNTKLSSSLAKCFASDSAMSITTDAVQLLGGAGYIADFGVERLMREAKMLQIVEGTNQIQRIIIAREIREMFED